MAGNTVSIRTEIIYAKTIVIVVIIIIEGQTFRNLQSKTGLDNRIPFSDIIALKI